MGRSRAGGAIGKRVLLVGGLRRNRLKARQTNKKKIGNVMCSYASVKQLHRWSLVGMPYPLTGAASIAAETQPSSDSAPDAVYPALHGV
jgi:hypothetical protein